MLVSDQFQLVMYICTPPDNEYSVEVMVCMNAAPRLQSSVCADAYDISD